jgi:predicted Zn-ribbon and HTH transcriptional regulator
MTTEENCPTGKTRHATADAARKGLRNLGRNPANRRTRGTGRPKVKVEPYRCPQCGSWHVGQPPTNRR